MQIRHEASGELANRMGPGSVCLLWRRNRTREGRTPGRCALETHHTRPTLDELWRLLLTTLEGLGAGDAPALARSLAIAGLTGRPAESEGVRVERHGEVVLVTVLDPAPAPDPPGRSDSKPGYKTRSVFCTS
jgi:hypothetical protein